VKRLRFFRILLPALLIPFLVLVVLEVKRRPQPLGIETGGDDPAGAVAEGVRVVDFEGTDLRLSLFARTTSGSEEDGSGVFEGVDRLELGREEGSPLIMSADWVRIEGPPGERKIEIKGGIEVTDSDAGMTIRLPALEVDEGSGEARSDGEVQLEAPGYHGTAETLLYRLDDKPSVIFGLDAVSDDGGRARADRATLLDGPQKVELEGNVRVSQHFDVLTAPRMLIQRREDGSLARIQAFDGVRGTGEPPFQEPYWFRAKEGHWWFDEEGEPIRMILEGDAAMQRGSDGLAAEEVRASRTVGDDGSGPIGWSIAATGGVFARGIVEGAPASLQAERVDGITDLAFNPLGGKAVGNVRFESRGSVAQGAWAEVQGTPLTGREVYLHSEGPLRARLASERRRVAADLIVTRPGENYLRAQGGVESTLLPAENDPDAPGQAGLFDSSVAVHFVSRTLESLDDGKSLVFEGNVRGWQGERNLAAEKVVYRQAEDEMHATGGVTTRMPRVETVSMSEADYVQITGQELVYTGETGLAVFRDDVRVRQVEGWMECARLEVHLHGESRAVEVIWAHDDVSLEYRAPGQQGATQTVHGNSDRAEFRLAEDVIRLFGVRTHATVRREGPDAVTTQGRVLLYRLDTGSVEVESGDQDRARIRTSRGSSEPD
jgi:lipopolysaccharide export system protein LptA